MAYGISDLEKRFLQEARTKRRKIAIGIWRPEPEVVDTIWQAAGYADLIVVGCDIPGLQCVPTKDDDEASRVIIRLLQEKKVEGFVRAQLKDSQTHKLFLEKFGKKEDSQKKPVFSILARDDYWFAAPSCSNYNALTLEQKRFEILRCIQWMEALGIKPAIGITSTRRLTGRVGEFGLLEDIAQRCQTVAEELRVKGYDVKEYYIEYERAIWEKRNLVCPSVGMIGNTWIKALTYLGGWHFVAGPYLDQGVYYDDSPRNNQQWFWPIISTVAWINRGKL